MSTTFGSILRDLRKKRGWTQSDTAQHLGLTSSSHSTYASYEQGTREPNISMLNKIADLFGVTVDYLMGRQDHQDTPVALEHPPISDAAADNIGSRIRALREAKTITQIEFMEKTGINNKTLSGYERGTSEPDIKTIVRLADYFGVTTDYLLRGTDIVTTLPAPVVRPNKETRVSLDDLKHLRDNLSAGEGADIPPERIPFIVDWLTKEIFFIEMLNNTKKTSR